MPNEVNMDCWYDESAVTLYPYKFLKDRGFKFSKKIFNDDNSLRSESAFLLNSDGSLFRTAYGQTVTIGVVLETTAPLIHETSGVQVAKLSYTDIIPRVDVTCLQEKVDVLEQALLDVILWNTDNPDNTIKKPMIIVPICKAQAHWCLGLIALQINDDNKFCAARLAIWDSMGSAFNGERAIIEFGLLLQSAMQDLTEHKIHGGVPIDGIEDGWHLPKRQPDVSSCGVITADRIIQLIAGGLIPVETAPFTLEQIKVMRQRQIDTNGERFAVWQYEARAHQVSAIEISGDPLELSKILKTVITDKLEQSQQDEANALFKAYLDSKNDNVERRHLRMWFQANIELMQAYNLISPFFGELDSDNDLTWAANGADTLHQTIDYYVNPEKSKHLRFDNGMPDDFYGMGSDECTEVFEIKADGEVNSMQAGYWVNGKLEYGVIKNKKVMSLSYVNVFYSGAVSDYLPNGLVEFVVNVPYDGDRHSLLFVAKYEEHKIKKIFADGVSEFKHFLDEQNTGDELWIIMELEHVIKCFYNISTFASKNFFSVRLPDEPELDTREDLFCLENYEEDKHFGSEKTGYIVKHIDKLIAREGISIVYDGFIDDGKPHGIGCVIITDLVTSDKILTIMAHWEYGVLVNQLCVDWGIPEDQELYQAVVNEIANYESLYDIKSSVSLATTRPRF